VPLYHFRAHTIALCDNLVRTLPTSSAEIIHRLPRLLRTLMLDAFKLHFQRPRKLHRANLAVINVILDHLLNGLIVIQGADNTGG
jgi:hypothetical protein